MSKISLEPNDSGAGTFSIVSPDSNTNRTLNLPDEAGKLLSTGNNDPAEVFKQSNILGTVSESGGAPTGAIIERGSNSNGEFVKYADGTMICTIPFDYDATTTAAQSFTYPATFEGDDVTFAWSGTNNNNLGAALGSSWGIRDSTTTGAIRAMTAGTGTSYPVIITVFGRWY